MNLSPNYFFYIEDYLSKFKTLKILCKECNIELDEKCFIYIILDKLGSAYFIFLSTFYATKKALGSSFKQNHS
jgi:hypothetical protein